MRSRRFAPWLISAAVHVLVIVGFIACATSFSRWAASVVMPVMREATITIGESTPEPTQSVPPAAASSAAASTSTSPTPSVGSTDLPSRHAREATSAARAATGLPWARRSLPLPSDVVSIAGVRQESVRRVVFLVDASGSMIGALPTAIDELCAAIGRLSVEQSFAVLAFQSGRSVPVPPEGLRRAGPVLGQRSIDDIRKWLDANVIASGSSEPRAALREAIAMKPDAIVVVSAGLLGVADSPADRDALLADLDALNPRDPRTLRRPVQFACIHLLEREPLGALQAIATEHGSPGAYRFIERLADLATPAEAPPRADGTTAEVERAIALLATAEAASARLSLLRIGLCQPLHPASPLALVCAAEFSLAQERDPRGALALASAAAQGARAFGLSTTHDRAQTVARAASDALRHSTEKTRP